MRAKVERRIRIRRGRRPSNPTIKVVFEEVETKSRVGVKYTHYRPVQIAQSGFNQYGQNRHERRMKASNKWKNKLKHQHDRFKAAK